MTQARNAGRIHILNLRRVPIVLNALLIGLALFAVGAQAADDAMQADAINPLIGSSHGGDTFPGATLPLGMLQWNPESTRGKHIARFTTSLHSISPLLRSVPGMTACYSRAQRRLAVATGYGDKGLPEPGKGAGAWLVFDPAKRPVQVRFGISYVFI